MNTKDRPSNEIGKEIAQHLLSMPIGAAVLNYEEILSGLVETLRCENVPPGLMVRGREKLPNGTYRLNCLDGVFIVPHFQAAAIKAADKLFTFNDFSQMRAGVVMQQIKNLVNAN